MSRHDRPARFAVIGAGWRAQFHIRMAQAAPDRLECTAALARRPQAREELRRQSAVPVVDTVEDLLATYPDYVIACVSWPAMPQVVEDLVARGVKVLAETPPAPDLDGLRRLWHAVGSTGLVQVAEQYMLMPGHASRAEVIRRGVIGRPAFVEVASTHMYHAVSMMRTFLGTGTEEAEVTASRLTAPLVDPLSFTGWRASAPSKDMSTTIATLDFGDGRGGLYVFVDNQWWNPLLARRLVVRGDKGEIVDDSVTYLAGEDVVRSALSYRRLGIDMNLEGNELDTVSFNGQVVYRNPWRGTRLSEDDIAVASFLEMTGQWARGEGPDPYPLRYACQDHYLSLVMEESIRSGRAVRASEEVWA